MAMISCPHCQRQSPEDARFCPYCGREITVPGEQVVEENTPTTAITGEDTIEATTLSTPTIEEEQTLPTPQEEHTVLASREEEREPISHPPQEGIAPLALQEDTGTEETVFKLADVQQEKITPAQPMQTYDSTPVGSYDQTEVENPYDAPIYYEEPQPLYYEEEPRPLLTYDEPIENPYEYESPVSYQAPQAVGLSTLPATPQPQAVSWEPNELGQYAATPVPVTLEGIDAQAIQPGTPTVPPPPQKPLWLRRPILTGALLLLIIVIIAGSVLQFRQGNPIKTITNYFLPKTMIVVTTTNIYALNAEDGKRLWDKPVSSVTDNTMQVYTLLEDGIVYIAGKSVSALDMRTGESKWNVPGIVESSFAYLHLYEDVLYVAGDRQIAAYNAGNGTMLWTRTINEQNGFIGYFSFLGQSICFTDNNNLYILDAKTGNTRLIHDLTRDVPRGSTNGGFWSPLTIPLGDKHVVLNWADLLENKGSVVAIDIESGNMAWRLDGNDHLFYLPDSDTTKKRNDKFYMYERKAARDYTFGAYNVQGATVWVKPIGDSSITIQGDQVYMAGSKQLQKWNLSDGNQVWSANSPGVQNGEYHSSSVGGSTLAVNAGQDVFGYDTNTATQKWKVPASSLIEVGPNQSFSLLTVESYTLFGVVEPDGEDIKLIGKLGMIHPETGKALWKTDLSGDLFLIIAN